MNRRGSHQRVRWLTRMALLTAAAVVLGYIERLIPMPGSIPGVKLGLANTVLLYAIYLLDARSAFVLMVLKVGLSGLMYGGLSAMMFSLGGGLCSLVMMLLVKKLGGGNVSIIGVSVVGAVFHNVGQTAVAALMVNTAALMGYVPFLLVAAVVTGILTGIAAKYAIRGLRASGLENVSMPEKEPKPDYPQEEPK